MAASGTVALWQPRIMHACMHAHHSSPTLACTHPPTLPLIQEAARLCGCVAVSQFVPVSGGSVPAPKALAAWDGKDAAEAVEEEFSLDDIMGGDM